MTLSEFYTQRTAALQTKSNQLKATLASKKALQAEQQKNSRFWIDRVSKLSAEIERSEDLLLTTTTVAEIEAIAIELRQLQINMRSSQTKMMRAQDDISTFKIVMDLLIQQSEQLAKELSAALKSEQSVTEMEEKHQTWFAAIVAEPLKSIHTEATTLLAGAVKEALAKLESETSTEFLALVTNRLQRYWQRQDDLGQKADSMELAWDPTWVTQYGQDGNIKIHSRKFKTAISALEEFVANAESVLHSAESSANRVLDNDFLNTAQKARFDALAGVADINAEVIDPEATLRNAEHELILRQRELQVARAIAKSNVPSLSDAELDGVPEVIDILNGDGQNPPLATMQASRDDALLAIKSASFDTVVEKELLVDAANAALNQATKEFLVDNPDVDPDIAPQLDAARSDVDTAKDELTTAQITMRGTPWYKLEEFEVAIPKASWANAMYLVRAQQRLDQLKDVVSADLKTALTTANAELATAIAEKSVSDDGFLVLNQLISQYRKIHQNARARGSEAAFGTARGQV